MLTYTEEDQKRQPLGAKLKEMRKMKSVPTSLWEPRVFIVDAKGDTHSLKQIEESLPSGWEAKLDKIESKFYIWATTQETRDLLVKSCEAEIAKAPKTHNKEDVAKKKESDKKNKEWMKQCKIPDNDWEKRFKDKK